MSSKFLHGMSASIHRLYERIGKVAVRHLRLLDVKQDLEGGFTSSDVFGMAALNDVGFEECDR